MEQERHARLQELFLAVSELPAGERRAFLDRECVGDGALRADLDRLLLAHDDSDPFLAEIPPLGSPPVDDADALVGTVFEGLYQVEALLGRGGMGIVYRARHLLLDDLVALKLLPRPVARDPVARDPAWLQRFMHEGQAARRFRHPNAVAVHDLRAAPDGTAYLVLEYVEGRTLRAEMRERQGMSADRVVAIVEAVAGALDAAHEAGVVHRDVKPENVMLGASAGSAGPGEAHGERVVKLLDLGIAKLLEAPERGASEALTREGAYLGTPRYMSPEQWGEIQRDGRLEVDGRADVYALGVTAYEMVCGEPPFRGEAWQDLRHEHVSGVAVAAHERVAGLAEGFGRAIERAMAKDRSDRFATAGDFARALGEGVNPGAETKRPAGEAGTSEGARTTGDASGRTATSPPTNLPEQLTSFVGREREVEEVIRLLGESRLVTVTGPGGIGKTRLALQAARESLDRFPDGVWFVDLAPIADPALIANALASALGVREQPVRAALDAVCEYAREKRLLVVLDNCEHLASACGAVATRLLRACPGPRVLATSREELGVEGETGLHAPPLDHAAFVRLFADRARAVRQSFEMTGRNAAAVVKLCQQLEGIPLAVELAAARIGVLTPAQMMERIGQRLDILATHHADVPSRHRTLRASIEWSHGLLGDEERRVLAELSVFRGGWTLEAAEQVARGPWPVARAEPSSSQSPSSRDPQSRATGHGPRATGVLDVLDRLRAASLVVADERGEEMRYRMLETIREFASERDEGAGDVRQRHAEFFAQLAETAEPQLEKADPEWLDRLDPDNDNVRAALERCGTGEVVAETGLRIVAGWWQWWRLRGHLSEGRAAAEAALARCPEGPPALRARALTAASMFCRNQCDFASALAHGEAALALWRDLDDREGVARSLYYLASVAITMFDSERAAVLAEESLGLARELGDRELLASVLASRGVIAENRGDLDAAADAFEEALALFREQGRHEQIVMALFYLAQATFAKREYDRAEALFEEGLASALVGGFAMQTASLLMGLGELKKTMGEYDRAEELCVEALERFRRLGSTDYVVATLQVLGSLSRAKGDYDRAAERLRESLAGFVKHGIKHFVADNFEELGAVAAATGREERAARLLGAAEALREVLGTSPWPADLPTIDAAAAAARATLGDEAFEVARAAGRALTLDEAAAEALS